MISKIDIKSKHFTENARKKKQKGFSSKKLNRYSRAVH